MGFPAHAGMDPTHRTRRPAIPRLPRTRGDGPLCRVRVQGAGVASPHTRGWTPDVAGYRLDLAGFPAHAGMDPRRSTATPRPSRLPRTRGDGPAKGAGPRPAHVASPHTRGWTVVASLEGFEVRGFPAHAGMDPLIQGGCPRSDRLPRTRGDGPPSGIRLGWTLRASPHTRGWTPSTTTPKTPRSGFPAHAGMDPARSGWSPAGSRLPRTRGDGPATRGPRGVSTRASPHTRGWTLPGQLAVGEGQGFPAHAGMDRWPKRP